MRVLLVEDDPTTSRSIELMLTHANLNVYATDLGEEGIDLAKLYDYDLILLDLCICVRWMRLDDVKLDSVTFPLTWYLSNLGGAWGGFYAEVQDRIADVVESLGDAANRLIRFSGLA